MSPRHETPPASLSLHDILLEKLSTHSPTVQCVTPHHDMEVNILDNNHHQTVGQLRRELKIKRWPVSECLKSLMVRYNTQ